MWFWKRHFLGNFLGFYIKLLRAFQLTCLLLKYYATRIIVCYARAYARLPYQLTCQQSTDLYYARETLSWTPLHPYKYSYDHTFYLVRLSLSLFFRNRKSASSIACEKSWNEIASNNRAVSQLSMRSLVISILRDL